MSQLPLTPRLDQAFRKLFGPEEIDLAARRLIDGCSPERLAVLDPNQLERIRAAALKRSGGSLLNLDQALQLAARDWRDLLVATGFEDLLAHDGWLDSMADATPTSPAR